ncbi:hypothetical protein GF312_20645 [Candidatus Poribacteria bacterium]|nr:hypothetical protein [Candidatus Poribacteria bacterium]
MPIRKNFVTGLIIVFLFLVPLVSSQGFILPVLEWFAVDIITSGISKAIIYNLGNKGKDWNEKDAVTSFLNGIEYPSTDSYSRINELQNAVEPFARAIIKKIGTKTQIDVPAMVKHYQDEMLSILVSLNIETEELLSLHNKINHGKIVSKIQVDNDGIPCILYLKSGSLYFSAGLPPRKANLIFYTLSTPNSCTKMHKMVIEK